MSRDGEETRYTMKEIAEATGIKITTLAGRRQRLNIEAGKGGYTLAEVKQIIKRPPRAKTRFSKQKANQLRQKLQTDGAI